VYHWIFDEDSLAEMSTHHFVCLMRKSTVSRMSSVSTERYSSAAVRQGNSEVKANQSIAEALRYRYICRYG